MREFKYKTLDRSKSSSPTSRVLHTVRYLTQIHKIITATCVRTIADEQGPSVENGSERTFNIGVTLVRGNGVLFSGPGGPGLWQNCNSRAKVFVRACVYEHGERL